MASQLFSGKRDRFVLGEGWGQVLANGVLIGLVILIGSAGTTAGSGARRVENPDYLIEHWSASDGLLENSALGVAQTADGYLWVGSKDGLLRFNGRDFRPAAQLFERPALAAAVAAVHADSSGRLWVGTAAGVWLCEKGAWRNVGPTNLGLRTVAEDQAGQVFVGSTEGQVFDYDGQGLHQLELPRETTPSGVFCCRDQVDGGIWLANRGFVGRRTKQGWQRFGPEGSTPPSIVAGPARGGGIWVYGPGSLCRYRVGAAPQSFVVPPVDQPRQLLEDRRGRIWLASNAGGLFRLGLDGGSQHICETNGLTHTSSWCLMEDSEGDLWLGTSFGGLYRLKDRCFKTIDFENGLPNRVTRALTMDASGCILVGTHGGGTARIDSQHAVRPLPSTRGLHVTSVLRDQAGGMWVGSLEGLFLEKEGQDQKIALPPQLGSVLALLQDTAGRVWVGAHGIGLVEGETCRIWRDSTALAGSQVSCLAEEPKTEALWVGTYAQGLFRFAGTNVSHVGPGERLPGQRISSLTFDDDGCLWVGIFGQGLAQIRGGGVTGLVAEKKGLPASTVGSMLTDGEGSFWLGSDRGILRVSSKSLHRTAEQTNAPPAAFDLFTEADGMHNPECAEGCQPTAVRDAAGRLWFATASGVVTVDPRKVELPTNAPPLVIERVAYHDRNDPTGNPLEILSPRGRIALPPGNTEVEVQCAALSYSTPERVRYEFQIKGVDPDWVKLRNRREFYFQRISHGKYPLRVRASRSESAPFGSPVDLMLTVSPFLWQTFWFRGVVLMGTIAGVGGTVWNVQHKKLLRQQRQHEQERVLAQEQARLASVLEGTTDFVGFASLSGSLFYVNPAGRTMAGLGDEDITRLNIRELYPPEIADFIQREALPQAAKKRTWSGETVLRRRDGRTVPVSQVIVAHTDASNHLVFHSTIMRDISESHRAQEERRKLEEQLRQSQKMEAIGQLCGGVAHDFNNLLTVVQGHVSLLAAHTDFSADAKDSVSEIGLAGERAVQLTRQLLAFSRRQVLRPRLLDLNEVVTSIAKMLQRLLGEDIRMQLHLHAQPLPTHADAGMLDQVLMNLAVNARDAMPNGGQLILGTSQCVLTDAEAQALPEATPGRYNCLSITDTGCGMTDEVKAHIFEPFFTTKDVGKGTGLGLATVFGIVRQHRGTVSVSSEVGRGTTFRILFPALEASELPTTKATPPTPARGRQETILLVEDDPAVRRLTGLVLTQHGYRVLEAANGPEALRIAGQDIQRIHLLLTDLVMPEGISGQQLAAELQKRSPRLRVIFMSGYSAEFAGRELALCEGQNFVQKPASTLLILETVRQCLDRQGAS